MTLFKKLSTPGLCLALLFTTIPLLSSQRLNPYIVARGDCLWTIAACEDVFNDAWQWPLLLNANPHAIDNPDRIEPGMMLTVPMLVSSVEAAVARLYAQNYGEEGVIYSSERVPAALAASPGKQPQYLTASPDFERGAVPASSFLWIGVLMALVVLSLALIKSGLPQAAVKEPETQARSMMSAARREPLMEGPSEADARHEPQPTESEAILRAMDDKTLVVPSFKEKELEEQREAA